MISVATFYVFLYTTVFVRLYANIELSIDFIYEGSTVEMRKEGQRFIPKNCAVICIEI